MLKNIATLVLFAASMLAIFAGIANQPARAAAVTGLGVTTAVSAPLEDAEEVITGTLIATDTEELAEIPPAVGSVTAATRWGNDSITQNVVIKADKNNTTRFCFKAVEITGSTVTAANDTCEEVCDTLANGDMTCSGAATDGIWMDPGDSVVQRYTNRFCFCGESASGTPAYQLRRGAR